MKSFIFFLQLLAFSAAAAWAQTYEVTLDKAEIRQSPSGSAIGSLVKGTRIEGFEKQGNWLRFRMEGWIYLPSLTLVSGPAPSGSAGGYSNVTPEAVAANPAAFKGKKLRIVGIKFYGYQPATADNIKISLGTEGVGFLPVGEVGQLEELELYQKLTVSGEILDVIGNSLFFMRIDAIEK